MLKLNAHVILRLLAGTAVAAAFGISPQLAVARAGGSLAELASPNNCIQARVDSSECPTTATGLSSTGDIAISPDGNNVYVIGSTDEAIAEFKRNANGSLTQLPSPNDCIAESSSTGTCSNATAVGLSNPTAIAISPDGKDVYVAAQDGAGNGDIAEFARNADGSLAQLPVHDCISEHVSEGICGDHSASGIAQPVGLAVSPDGTTVYAVDTNAQDVAWFSREADGSLSQTGGPDQCIEDSTQTSTECGSTAVGIASVTGVTVSPDGNNVYTTGAVGNNGTITEFARSADGLLTQLASPNDGSLGMNVVSVTRFRARVVRVGGEG
jgi:DNA-binding beta-propeller fold protein YncE